MLEPMPDQYYTFILHFVGAKGTGKSTIHRLVASAYGNPNPLVTSWDTTHVGLDRLPATCRHLPAFVDETGANSRGPLVMMVASGVGRTRGAPDGLRATARCRNVVLSTGETTPTGGRHLGSGFRRGDLYMARGPIDAFDISSRVETALRSVLVA